MVIGFANGSFDRFHDGHRHFLRECKMNCDRLIIGINQTGEHKGIELADRFAQRARRVLDYAEMIYGFGSEEELLELMKATAPDVIFKGEDYYGKPITGGTLARIHWVARHPGYSSTIERAKAKA